MTLAVYIYIYIYIYYFVSFNFEVYKCCNNPGSSVNTEGIGYVPDDRKIKVRLFSPQRPYQVCGPIKWYQGTNLLG